MKPDGRGETLTVLERKTTGLGPSQSEVPPDLSAWVGRKTLLNLVLSVVQAFYKPSSQTGTGLNDARVLSPRVMWTLLTYCYAAGIYRPRDIERTLSEDEAVRVLCASHVPDHDAIRRFQFQNRPSLERCLETVCLVAWKLKFGHWWGQRRSRNSDATRRFPWQLDPLIHRQVICEVRQRLDRAEESGGCFAG